MRVAKVSIDSIHYGGSLPGNPEPLTDGAARPLIVEPLSQGYSLIDGYHRLDGLLAAGETEATVIVVDADDCARCSEFGGSVEDMGEGEWIEWVQDAAADLV